MKKLKYAAAAVTVWCLVIVLEKGCAKPAVDSYTQARYDAGWIDRVDTPPPGYASPGPTQVMIGLLFDGGYSCQVQYADGGFREDTSRLCQEMGQVLRRGSK